MVNMIAVVVPAYNEEKEIGRVVRDLFRNGDYRVIVVDDGSKDNTREEALRAGAVVVSHLVNRGQGASLATGNMLAIKLGAKAIVHFDGDGQFSSEEIAEAVNHLWINDLDIVFGTRFSIRRSELPLTKRYILLPIARVINYLLTGIWLTDAHNGFRVFTDSVGSQMQITQDGMAHNSEILASVKKYKWRHAEYPITVKYSEYGQGVAGGVKIIWDWIISKLIR